MFETKAEADLALADETLRLAHGRWHDPRLSKVPLGEWFRECLASRGEIAESPRAIYQGLLDWWIDAPPTVERPNGRTRVIHLWAQTLGSVTPADVRARDSALLPESTRRAIAKREGARRRVTGE